MKPMQNLRNVNHWYRHFKKVFEAKSKSDRTGSNCKGDCQPDGLTADEIPDSYARLLLSSNDISEVDTSGDYQVVIEDELESEYESDAEEVFIDSQRGGHILGGSRYPYIKVLHCQYMNYFMEKI